MEDPSAGDTTNALRAAYQALANELKGRTELFATTSHELRTSLNGILGMTQVMLAEFGLDKGVRERIAVVHGAGEAMKALLDDILDVAKIETGSIAIHREPVDLRALIEDAARLWRPQADAKGVALDIALGGCPETIEGDATRLRQILFNLLANAVKFTETGTIAVSAAAEPGEHGGEVLALRVRDTGIGVDEAHQAHVFDRYRQADPTIARRYGGTGLGLAICYRLAHAMGGTITLASRPGEGSTFAVLLPLRRVTRAAPPQPPGPPTPASGAARLDDARVLILAENALTQRILRNMIAPFVRDVQPAATADEAIARLARGGLDHVIADHPDFAGGRDARPATIDSLATAAAASGARLTLLLASADDRDAAAVTAGRCHVQAIAKPIAVPLLVAELGRLYPRPDGDDPLPRRSILAVSA